MSVDLPKPDSPGKVESVRLVGNTASRMTTIHTDDHGGELEALAHALPVHLVGKVGKAHVAVELFANDGRGCWFRGLWERRGGTVHLARGAVGGEGVAVGGGRNVRVCHLRNVQLKRNDKK